MPQPQLVVVASAYHEWDSAASRRRPAERSQWHEESGAGGSDVNAGSDAWVATDAANDTDGSVLADAAQTDLTATAADSAVARIDPDTGGCGCSSTRAQNRWALWGLALTLFAWRRRR